MPRMATKRCGVHADENFKKKIREAEERVGRAICGARKPDGVPCECQPTPNNGRCILHGGLSTGAPRGNKNARRHGMYVAGIEEAEYPEIERRMIGLAEKYNLDLNNPRVEMLLRSISQKTVQLDRGNEHVRTEGLIVEETYPDHVVQKLNPAADAIVRLGESLRRDMQDLLGMAVSADAGKTGGNTGGVPMLDAVILHLLNTTPTKEAIEMGKRLLAENIRSMDNEQ